MFILSFYINFYPTKLINSSSSSSSSSCSSSSSGKQITESRPDDQI